MAVLTEEAVAEALREFDGNMAAVGRKFGVSRVAVWLYVDARESLKQICAEEKERLVDDVEGDLLRNCRSGNVAAQIFFLKTQARHRGYSERLEVTGDGGGPLQLNVVFELPRQLDHEDETGELDHVGHIDHPRQLTTGNIDHDAATNAANELDHVSQLSPSQPSPLTGELD